MVIFEDVKFQQKILVCKKSEFILEVPSLILEAQLIEYVLKRDYGTCFPSVVSK